MNLESKIKKLRAILLLVSIGVVALIPAISNFEWAGRSGHILFSLVVSVDMAVIVLVAALWE